MTQLSNAGFVNNTTIANLTANKLAIIVPASNPLNITNMSSLATPGIKLVVCNASVPCGAYTVQMLNKMANMTAYGQTLVNNINANVVSQETEANDVVSQVALGQADAGIVYASDVPASMQSQVQTIMIPDSINVLAIYQIGVVKQSSNQAAGESYVQFLQSPAGQAILAQYGFLPV
jgi:molybdate transport system substrate-binding protein